jgi:hypothetical protein
MSSGNPPLVMTGVKFSGGVQILNYDTFVVPVYENYILMENNNLIDTEDGTTEFVTE